MVAALVRGAATSTATAKAASARPSKLPCRGRSTGISLWPARTRLASAARCRSPPLHAIVPVSVRAAEDSALPASASPSLARPASGARPRSAPAVSLHPRDHGGAQAWRASDRRSRVCRGRELGRWRRPPRTPATPPAPGSPFLARPQRHVRHPHRGRAGRRMALRVDAMRPVVDDDGSEPLSALTRSATAARSRTEEGPP